MAVASSRDSSSLKALAVITAIFLPGEFIGTLFGMSMFDWLARENEEPDDPSSSPGANPGPTPHLVTNDFWIYWAVTIPLTLLTLFFWRAWWVNQDRYFRRHLSRELSEERFWTSDGKPRNLDRGFIHDLFYLSARREEKVRLKRERSPREDMWEGLPFSKTLSAASKQPLGRTVSLGKDGEKGRATGVAV